MTFKQQSFIDRLKSCSFLEGFQLIKNERDAGRLKLVGNRWEHDDGSVIEIPGEPVDVIQIPRILTALEGEGR